jgi:hypothetical protein
MKISKLHRVRSCWFAFLFLSASSYATTISVGPATGGAAVFLFDQGAALSQKWGFVFTAPTDESVLQSISFFVRPTGGSEPATFFTIQIREWLNSTPIGSPIFESDPFYFADPNPNQPEYTEYGIRPVTFQVAAQIEAGKTYVAEFDGDGLVGMLLAAGYAGGGLYLQQGSIPWSAFGDYDVRTEIVFGDGVLIWPEPEPEPEPVSEQPNTFALLTIGAVLCAILQRRSAFLERAQQQRGLHSKLLG